MKLKIVSLITAISLLLLPGVVHAVSAVDPRLCSGEGAKSSACNTTNANPVTGSDSLLLKATNIVAAVAGVIAVVMVMYSGLQMMTASGDSKKFSDARQTLIYAAVGIVVIILARTAVAFIVNTI